MGGRGSRRAAAAPHPNPPPEGDGEEAARQEPRPPIHRDREKRMTSMFHILADVAAPGIDQFTNLSMAGLMGAMWLWERRTSRQREQQLDEAHARIIEDRVQLDQLLDVVRQNTEAITKLGAAQDQLASRLTLRKPE